MTSPETSASPYAPGLLRDLGLPVGTRRNGNGAAMTTEQAEAMRQQVSDDPVRLPDGQLSCASCGVATPGDIAASVPVFNRRADGSDGVLRGHIDLARCADCQQVRQQAEAIVAEHPGLASRVGSVLVDQVEGALVALEIIGKALPDRTSAPVAAGQEAGSVRPEITDRDLRTLLDNLAAVGARARWQSMVVGIGGGERKCAPHPYAAVREGQRRQLRAAYAATLKARMSLAEPPVDLPPPPFTGTAEGSFVMLDQACCHCGLKALRTPAVQVARLGGREAARRHLWQEVHATPAAFGSKGSGSVKGWMCPWCAEVAQSVGTTARERAICAHVERTKGEAAADRLRASYANAIFEDRPPATAWARSALTLHMARLPQEDGNTTAWQHLAHHARLREFLT